MRDESENNGEHDLRFAEFAAMIALLLAVVATAYTVITLERPTPTPTLWIVPSQTVKW
jgi:hypothetical protein